MITPKCCTTKEAMVRLWVHESLRVFHDRLISVEDKAYFRSMLRHAQQARQASEGPARQ